MSVFAVIAFMPMVQRFNEPNSHRLRLPWKFTAPGIIWRGKDRLPVSNWLRGKRFLSNIRSLPRFLSAMFLTRYTNLLKTKGLHDANKWLVFQFDRRIWPRLQATNAKHAMNLNASMGFYAESINNNALPGISDKELKRFAERVAGTLMQNFDRYCEECLAENGGDNAVLIEDSVQAEFYGRVAGMARAFNITPMHWGKYRKGKMDATSAIASVSRLVNAEWWERQFKAQRGRSAPIRPTG